ncbi:TPA: efflux RND transporter periplasmic adaptor subunit [Pseudomonas aeruginosa]|mgnify:CR=1 FL=1|jgi:multidrug efflux system membrane fusion protein|uniref:Efflux RND transporter periplasmic adaptor subunit n=4 Tax=Pseudomonadota TaxID=1224 RepID=A0AAN4D568_CITFR|nr:MULTISPECIES: efflux RND transporter periplasmic adaptor subunit [Pseudomonadota]EKU3006290.1 efflux RND transporter periplasmic adaptor subunit [Klebsiella pneumoniae]MBP7656239.1 efflux RND transporter periplasmic adaptor subunit [Pseudoxanthomonas sp.]QAR68043.1 MexX family efflux pump subunit [Citrobacter sp. SL156]HBI3003888.1 efflux RND transporter periplasmic adaptor subunit [Citrobacter farmeri]HDS1148703.1 efflux RND transporter periplasmic adaptor subunit [Stenotrophomonas maltoph
MPKHLQTRWRSLSALVAVVLLVSGCGDKQGDANAQAPVPVEAVAAQPQPFTLTAELPGRIEPVRVAEVRARVAGIVLRRTFEEGANVKAGDVLFQIDPAPFKAALSRARGDLAKAEAALVEARSVVRRYEPLVQIEAVSRQDFDAAQATLRGAEASRQSAAAEVETAQLNLDYATVRAPISGRIGRALVTEGALVGQNEATPLATIQQLDPIYADFKQPVNDLVRLRKSLADGKLKQAEASSLPISITVEGSGDQRTGQLLFSDVTVDRDTGQVSLRGRFANTDGLLLPGMYVRVHIDQGVDPQAILVPQRAVKRNTDGKAYVLVADAQDTVQTRTVQTGAMRGSQWQIVGGLQPGERVIVSAPGALQAGAKVTVKTDQAAAPSAEAAGARN